MPSNKESVRKHREKKRNDIGDAEYKRIESEKRKSRRDKNKPTTEPISETTDIFLEKIYNLKLDDAILNDKTIKLETVRKTLNNLQNLYKYYTKSTTNFTDFSWVRDTSKLIEFIQDRKHKKFGFTISSFNFKNNKRF